MTELTRFKNAIDNDMNLRLQYLKILAGLMVGGEVTPEMTSVAAKKLGFDISADDFKNEVQDAKLSEDELNSVNGGVSSFNNHAPDGRKVGCPYQFYFTWTDYWINNDRNYCPIGGVHDCEDTSDGEMCLKCRLEIHERGLIDIYDRIGKEIK